MEVYEMLSKYDNKYKFSEIMAMARERKGVTMMVVAENTGLSGPLISQIESGYVASSRFLTIVKLSKYYDIPLDLLARYASGG